MARSDTNSKPVTTLLRPQVDRRRLLVDAGAAVIAATAAVTLGSNAQGAATDPVFAAIDKCEAAVTALNTAADALRVRETSLPDELSREPRCALAPKREGRTSHKRRPDGTLIIVDRPGPLTGEFYYGHNESDIVKSVPRGMIGAERDAWIAERLAELERDTEQLANARDAAGITALENAERNAKAREVRAFRALAKTTPTTLAGTLALVRYIIDLGGTDFDDALLNNCAVALARLEARA